MSTTEIPQASPQINTLLQAILAELRSLREERRSPLLKLSEGTWLAGLAVIPDDVHHTVRELLRQVQRKNYQPSCESWRQISASSRVRRERGCCRYVSGLARTGLVRAALVSEERFSARARFWQRTSYRCGWQARMTDGAHR